MISREELESLISTPESYRIERTTATGDMDKYCHAICAFSNDVSGSRQNGYLLLGVDDAGGLSGLRVSDELQLKLSNIRTDGNILPQPLMSVEVFRSPEGDVLVVEVQPSPFPPVRYRGRVWVRVGPRKSMATEAEEKLLVERRISHMRTFDAMPCLGSSLSDLDLAVIKRDYLPSAIDEEVLSNDQRGIKEQLASLGFYDLRHDCPTYGSIVLFGTKPERYVHGAYIQYVRFGGKTRADDIMNEHKFAGSLCRVLPKLDAFIETSVAQKRPLPVSVLREETVSKYPYWATRELLMNAVMHRDYESNAPIIFYEYDDHIEIQNHGGLYGKVNKNNFPDVNDYRNPFIAEAMKVLGYVNRFSRGVSRVQRELREIGADEATFDLDLLTAFRVSVPASRRFFELGFGDEWATEDTTESTNKLANKTTDKTAERTTSEEEEKLLRLLAENPRVSVRQLAVSIGVTQYRVRRLMSSLRERGLIAHTTESTNKLANKSTNKTTGRTTDKLSSSLLSLLRDNSGLSIAELSHRLSVTTSQVRYQLRLLSERGRLQRVGSKKTGVWLVIDHE